jgi:hypothetical protein
MIFFNKTKSLEHLPVGVTVWASGLGLVKLGKRIAWWQNYYSISGMMSVAKTSPSTQSCWL